MAKSVVLFGPQGSGKSLNADGLMKAYGLKESFDLDDPWFPRGRDLRRRLDAGLLVLSCDIEDSREFARRHDALLITVATARLLVGAAWRDPR